MDKDAIAGFLADIKQRHLSSPAGTAWQEFHQLLSKHRSATSRKIPLPLILAASVESDQSKHTRLGEQLQWASENGCLEEAMAFLMNLPRDGWNSGSPDTWAKTWNWE